VGTTLGEWSSNGWDANAVLNRRLVHIEALESNLTRSPMARLHVRGRLLSIFETVVTHLDVPLSEQDSAMAAPQQESQQWKSTGVVPWHNNGIEQLQAQEGWQQHLVNPKWLMQQLICLFPPSTRYLADSGSSVAWAIHYLHPFDRRILERRHSSRADSSNCGDRSEAGRRSSAAGLFQAALEFSSMGWAIGASVGASLACPHQTIVCITGDGSMLMSGQEITVAQQHRLPVVFVVLNDSSLGMVKHGQRLAGAESVGHELPRVDFCAMAEAMGVRGFRIRCPQDLLELSIADFQHGEGPVLLDVRIDPEAVPPMGLRMKVLK
jgi:acetolactate synthase-1/2/3 large subunit